MRIPTRQRRWDRQAGHGNITCLPVSSQVFANSSHLFPSLGAYHHLEGSTMIRINTKASLVCIAVTFLAPASAQTGAWTPPVALSTGGQGWEAAAAIDGNGNSLAIWDERTSEDHIWSRAKPSAGNWGRVTQVSPGRLGLQTTLVFPAVRISAAGFATAVWTDANGVWTADRPPTGTWNPAQLLVPGASDRK